MGLFGDDLGKIMRQQNNQLGSTIRKQDKHLKKTIRKQNEDLKKLTNTQVKTFISKEGRVPIKAKRKHEVEDRYNNKCAVCKEKPRGVTLQIHHKNGKNSDNSLKNLELLCPNHHYAKHSKGSKLNKTIRKRNVKKRK